MAIFFNTLIDGYIRQALVWAVSEQCLVGPVLEATWDSNLVVDVGLNRLDIIRGLLALESYCDIQIPGELMNTCQVYSIGGITNILVATLKNSLTSNGFKGTIPWPPCPIGVKSKWSRYFYILNLVRLLRDVRKSLEQEDWQTTLQRYTPTTPVTTGSLTFEQCAYLTNVPRDIEIAARLLHPGVVCLPRALATRFLLRQKNINATLCIGIHPPPFASHAWIEYRGIILDQEPDLRILFKVIGEF